MNQILLNRFRIARFFIRYLNGFIPPDQSVIANDHTRQKVNILIGVCTVLFLVQGFRASLQFQAHYLPVAFITLSESLFSLFILLFIINFRGKGIVVLQLLFLAFFYITTTADYILAERFPPVQYVYVGVMVLVVHVFLGRWPALLTLVLHSFVMFGVYEFYFKELMGSGDPMKRDGFLINTVLAGLLVWVITEAYDRVRTRTEQELRNTRKALERDFELARNIQMDLLVSAHD